LDRRFRRREMLDLVVLALDHGDPPRSSFEDDLM
jgi:hypothetical protein